MIKNTHILVRHSQLYEGGKLLRAKGKALNQRKNSSQVISVGYKICLSRQDYSLALKSTLKRNNRCVKYRSFINNTRKLLIQRECPRRIQLKYRFFQIFSSILKVKILVFLDAESLIIRTNSILQKAPQYGCSFHFSHKD